MKIFNLDNSGDSDLKRVILWQYDLAEKFVGWVGIFRGFFYYSTQLFWDSMPQRINISVAENLEEFALSIWGTMLGVGRPVVTVDGVKRTISSELYRRMLLGRFQLACSNASKSAYEKFVDLVFGDNVSVTDNGDMSMDFTWIGPANPTTDSEKEMKAVVENKSDLVFLYPAGVKSHDESNDSIFGFEEQYSETAEHVQTAKTSVDVRCYGSAGTVFPTGMKFTKGGITWATVTSYTVSNEGYVDARFVCLSTVTKSEYIYLNRGAVGNEDVITSIGDAVPGLSECTNLVRSHTDFFIGNFSTGNENTNTDAATFAWNRFKD